MIINNKFKKCIDRLQTSIDEARNLRKNITIGELYEIQKTYNFSNELMIHIFLPESATYKKFDC